MELSSKELTFPIEVIGTNIHRVSQTRKRGEMLIPELVFLSDLSSLHRHTFQVLCLCPSFSLFLRLLQPPNRSLRLQCHPSIATRLSWLLFAGQVQVKLYRGLRGLRTSLLHNVISTLLIPGGVPAPGSVPLYTK